ncbi:MAG TPA: efflux RND transporter periplasmic adaptor subunit [Polyangiaceae bacterium]|nr:efflux RND transporter periplasmic adaptor subunit [Polyangiaceae bacterium]
MPKTQVTAEASAPRAKSELPTQTSSRPTSAEVGPAPTVNPKHEAVVRLERELVRQARRRWLKLGFWVVALGAGAFWFLRARSHEAPPEPRFRTRAVELRDIVERVESTGRLKPLTEVQVGAQVSGRVVKVLVDYNTRVKQGQLLAEIDPQLLGAQVGQVTGQLESAKANVLRAVSRVQATDIDLARIEQLAKNGLASQAELDQARSAVAVARAEQQAAEATLTGLRSQLSSARTTLTYTKIFSPIDGVVISRNVEPGQTVAASFSTPVLFVIAEDLAKMQALADIDEADVGKVKEDMLATVSVDAFAGEDFPGKVTQIRYSPTEVQGVVTYSAVIDVANPELKLRPGMTATVSITTREAKGVVAAPNAALRFRPTEKEERDLTPLQHGQARLYVISGGAVGSETLKPVVAKTGLSDGVWTELSAAELSAGAQLVTEQVDKLEKKKRFMGLF